MKHQFDPVECKDHDCFKCKHYTDHVTKCLDCLSLEVCMFEPREDLESDEQSA